MAQRNTESRSSQDAHISLLNPYSLAEAAKEDVLFGLGLRTDGAHSLRRQAFRQLKGPWT